MTPAWQQCSWAYSKRSKHSQSMSMNDDFEKEATSAAGSGFRGEMEVAPGGTSKLVEVTSGRPAFIATGT